jgi:hypothetical protein
VPCDKANVISRSGLGSSGATSLCVKVKVKVKFTLEHATKAQRGSRVIALIFQSRR